MGSSTVLKESLEDGEDGASPSHHQVQALQAHASAFLLLSPWETELTFLCFGGWSPHEEDQMGILKQYSSFLFFLRLDFT